MPSRASCLTALWATLLVACATDTEPTRPRIESEIVSSADVLGALDASRTFEYRFATVQPESLLTVLWEADLVIAQALEPLDNLCEDPLGPRFTVELLERDPRILDYDFQEGLGRLACTTTLRKFTILAD